jgi:hypothetical protein
LSSITASLRTLYDQIEALERVLWSAYDRLGAELLDEADPAAYLKLAAEAALADSDAPPPLPHEMPRA